MASAEIPVQVYVVPRLDVRIAELREALGLMMKATVPFESLADMEKAAQLLERVIERLEPPLQGGTTITVAVDTGPPVPPVVDRTVPPMPPVVDLMARLEQSVADAKAARLRGEQ